MPKQKMRGHLKRLEVLLGIVAAIFLVGSLLSESYWNFPKGASSFMIFAYIIVRIYELLKSPKVYFEDFLALVLIFVFGIVHLFVRESVNAIVVVAIVFVLVYSIGLVPWVDELLKSRKIVSFILSYTFFVLMIILLFAGLYYSNNELFLQKGKPIKLSFEESLYFSTITFTTVGYGDIAPLATNRLIAAIEAVGALILNIAFIGYIFSSRRFRK
ncbi:two pore domain potassium channel family protein [Candidatus Pacearchaeota archaeon]|nr:MAG: two pore domain potassium channel family protein [Candidatus Pacearchaeota archaeon]